MRTGLLVVSKFLRHPAQLMIGAGLAIAVVELDFDIEGLLIVRTGLLVVSKFLRHPAQLMVGACLAIAIAVRCVDI